MNTQSDKPTASGVDFIARVRHYVGSANVFLAWWKRNLVAWLPVRWRLLLGLAPDRLLLSCGTDGLQVRRQHDTQIRTVAQAPLPLRTGGFDSLLDAPLARLPHWLVLPATAVLRRRLTLPAAAAERLRDVAGFEIDRQTPFTVAAVRYDAFLLQRRADGLIDVELIVAPRREIDETLAALGDAGAGLAGIDVATADNQTLGVNLLPPDARGRRRDPLQRWNLMLAVVALLALMLAARQVLQNRHDAVARFTSAAEANAVEARRISAQRQRLTDLVEGADFLERTRAATPTTLEVMDELSRRLPDNTYLEKLAIENNRLLLIGLSSEVPSLVARMEGSSLWRTPALTGALQRDPRSRRDRFTLTAELVNTAPASTAQGSTPQPGDNVNGH